MSFAPANAHDTFLLPSSFRTDATNTAVDVDLTSAETFAKREYGPKSNRVSKLEARGSDGRLAIASEGKDALRLQFSAGVEGLHVIGVALAPHDIDLAPDKVAEYFEEIGASAELRRAYEARADRQWHETYTKYAKSLICVVTCSGVLASKPLGFALEFTRVASNSATTGNERFRLLRHGLALTNQAVAISDASGQRHLQVTDADGAFTVETSGSGAYLLSAVCIDIPAAAHDPFKSDFATLTFAATGSKP